MNSRTVLLVLCSCFFVQACVSGPKGPPEGLLALTEAKERSAREFWQEFWQGVILILSMAASAGGGNAIQLIPVDLHQQIGATLATGII